MQTRTSSSAMPADQRGRLAPFIAAACAAVVLGGASAGSPAKAPAPPTTYRVIPLAPSGFNASINATGQVAFTEFVGDVTRARFYDGTAVRDLGTFGGTSALAYAVNDLGQVAGTASVDPQDSLFHAFRWSRQTGLVDLNGPGAGYSAALDINNKGQVVGTTRAPGELRPNHAFRWSPHTGMAILASPGNEAMAFGINDAGTAAGYSAGPDSGNLLLAARWPAAGGPLALNGFPSMGSIARDINNAGQIVGSAAFDGRLSDQAFIWTAAGGLRGLGTEPSYRSSAERINQNGLVIGELFAVPGDANGFVWSRESGLHVIGTPLVDRSDVSAVNNLGQVVGSLNGRPFVWTRATGVVDLNSRLVGAPPDLELLQAEAISDNGSIAAIGNGGLVLLVPQSAYMLPPVTGPVKFTGAARVNALLSFSAGFTDVDVRDTHKAVWSWGDGSKSTGVVNTARGTGSVSGQHAWRAAGIYTVRLTVTDSSGRSSTAERTVVVCAADAVASGQGTFATPANAAQAGVRRAPIGSFAFLSEGQDARKAAVQVNVAGMALRSSEVDAVTLDGARVQYSGRGTVNGAGNYRFTLTATAGAKGGGKDRIHVRISHSEPGSKAEVVDYDNGAGTQAEGAARQAAAAGVEGSVVIGDGKIELGAR